MAKTLQQAANQLLSGDEAPLGQRRRQMTLALAHPAQGSLRITADRGLDQRVQGGQKPRLRLDRRLASAARTPNARVARHRAGTQISQTTPDGAACKPGRLRNRHHAAASRRARLAGREQPPPSLVQDRRKRLETGFDGSDVDHPVRIDAPAAQSRLFPDSFVAFLSPPRFFYSDSVAWAQVLILERVA